MKLKTTIYGKSSTLIGTPDEISALLDAVRRTARQRAVDSLPRIVAAGERLGSKPAPKEPIHVKNVFKPTFEPIAQTREEIVNEAIADVAELLGRNHPQCKVKLGAWFVADNGIVKNHDVEFLVYKTKRIVVANISYLYAGENPLSTGIARCAPSDVFNEHVGKAIALRRALGLEVPTKYYEVGGMVPKGKQVGDIIRGYSHFLGRYEDCLLANDPQLIKNEVGINSFFATQSKVIDDSARYVAPSTPAAKVVYVD